MSLRSIRQNSGSKTTGSILKTIPRRPLLIHSYLISSQKTPSENGGFYLDYISLRTH